MGIFKIDEYKIFENSLQDLTLREFLALDHIPKGLSEEAMSNFTKNILAEKKRQEESGLEVEDVLDKTIFQIIMEAMINTGEVSEDELDDILEESGESVK